jgi:hypothetical protein
LPLIYRGHRLNCGYRLDRVHHAQLLSYLRQQNIRLGLLINFNVKWLQDGIKRVVNGFPE